VSKRHVGSDSLSSVVLSKLRQLQTLLLLVTAANAAAAATGRVSNLMHAGDTDF
jgi:hypothetical protein